jgi:cell wall-associated NlpC family hydrolase
LDKITRTILFFSLIILMSLAATSCQSSKTASKSKSATTGKGYVRKKSKSGNKRANHRSSRSAREAAFKKSKTTPAPAKSKSAPVESTKAAGSQAIQVIKTARTYLGTPYRYGGSTSKGMDCSGLLCTSFASIDVKLPRTSTEQASYGKDVRLNDIAPGDLVFFAERQGSSKISHVGLVTAVKRKEAITFIHSSTSRGVVEDNLFGEYYQKIFVKAIRPF